MTIDTLYTLTRDGYTISTDRARLDMDRIFAYLTNSYWSPGVPEASVRKAIANSLCFGLYAPDGSQVGFARVITDFASFAYLADVFVLADAQGRGLGVWLIASIEGCPLLTGIRNFLLATRDAHGLYEKFGFTRLEAANPYMIKRYAMPWRRTAQSTALPAESNHDKEQQ